MLVNIGLAYVSSAVVISTMTDNFPKTERLPSIATFVQDQFVIIVSVLIILSVRKAVMGKIDKALEKWQKVEKDEKLTRKMKILIVILKIPKHRLFLFVIFGTVYTICFAILGRNADFNFDQIKQE